MQKKGKKSAFSNKSAQKSTLKSTFGSLEPICIAGQLEGWCLHCTEKVSRFVIEILYTPHMRE